MDHSAFFSFCFVLVCITITYRGYQLLSFIYLYIRSSPSSLKCHLQENAYAMITGATDGIGKAIAIELAAYGFNLILHGRNTEKLELVQHEINAMYPDCRITTICRDGGQEPISDISSIKGLPVTVLVNNVGVGPIGSLATFPVSEIGRTVNLNILFPTYLTRSLLALENQLSLIINISSYAGLFPPPFLAVYAGTKAYNNAFSKALSVELENATVISMLVGSVHTGSNTKPVSFMRPDAGVFAKRVIRMAGAGRKSVYPYWPHAVQTYVLSLLPAGFIDRVMRKAMRREL